MGANGTPTKKTERVVIDGRGQHGAGGKGKAKPLPEREHGESANDYHLRIFEYRLAESVGFLIRSGHRFADVMGYTLRQVDALTGIAEVANRRGIAEEATGARNAYHADKDGFNQYIERADE
jgi:hypothetical protein